jgi:hypothetical protein
MPALPHVARAAQRAAGRGWAMSFFKASDSASLATPPASTAPASGCRVAYTI